TQTSAAPQQSEEEMEKLRSLGYLDTSGLPKQKAGGGARLLDPARACPGNTIIVFASSCSAELQTLDGRPIRSWHDPEECHMWEHAELQPDGNLLVVGMREDVKSAEDPVSAGRFLLRMDGNRKVLWRKAMNAHHDVSVTPDGKLLT